MYKASFYIQVSYGVPQGFVHGPDLFHIKICHSVAKLLDSMGYISMVMLMALRNIPPKKPFEDWNVWKTWF